MDLQVIQIEPGSGKVAFGITGNTVSGLRSLVQTVVLSLFNIPGKDILDPTWGSGIQEMIAMNFLDTDTSAISAEMTRRLKKTQSEIQARQIGLSLDASERLREIRFIGLSPGQDQTEIFVTIRVISELGQQTDIVV